MKVLNRGIMPDKTKIQLEDWSEDYPSFHAKSDVIAAYPIAKVSASRTVFEGINRQPCVWEYPPQYHSFRLCLRFPCGSDAEKAYSKLLDGTARLLDYVEYMEEKKYAACI